MSTLIVEQTPATEYLPESESQGIQVTQQRADLIINLLSKMILLQGHLRLYGQNNANVELTSSQLFQILSQLFEAGSPVVINVARHGFMNEDGFISRSNMNFETFANRFFQHGIAVITLHDGVSLQAMCSFLLLTARKPSETWDEGGIENCLKLRSIQHLVVREMVEQDFSFAHMAPESVSDTQLNRSFLWENLTMSILQGRHMSEGAHSFEQLLSPRLLAEMTNQQLAAAPEEEQASLARELSRFLISLKHEKIKIYRMEALRHLSEYVNNLSIDLRNLFLNDAFNLNLDADLSEGFMSNLSDQVIMDALNNASAGKQYTPPVILKLLGRLAEERGVFDQSATFSPAEASEQEHQLKSLFKQDDFDAFVPKQYQAALLNIVKSNRLPQRVSEHLDQLKATVEQGAIDSHIGEILLEMLGGGVDHIHAVGIRSNILSTLNHHLGSRNYKKIIQLYEMCSEKVTDQSTRLELIHYFSSESFTSTVLDDLSSADKESSEEIGDLITTVRSPFVDPLIERLSAETSKSARRTYLNALLRLGDECKTKVLERLADSRWFVTRNMLYLLREFGDPKIVPHIRRYLGHPHPKIQRETLKTCLFFRDSKAIPYLLEALGAKEESTLVTAINLASLAGDPRVSERLAALLSEGTIMNYRLEIKKAAVRALAVSSPARAVPAFEDVLASRTLFQSRFHDALKLEIISVLEKLPPADSIRMLQNQLLSGSPEVIHSARMVLTKITGNTRHE